MAANHARSNSFPSKQHPLIPEFDEQLRRLRSSQEFDEQLRRLRSSQEASSSSTLLESKLIGLQDLHDCVEQLLSLPSNQQALSKEHNEKSVNSLLDGSLRILDACNATKDALTQTKESTQEILSILRRRRGGDLSSEVRKFMASRKVVKKALIKVFANRFNSSPVKESVEIVSMLREVESITLTVFESSFSFIAGPKSQKSLLSKLMNSKRVVCNKVNEFERVEASLKLLQKSDKKVEENAQIELQKLEMCIQNLEEGIERLYRRLIKNRVSMLNILNH